MPTFDTPQPIFAVVQTTTAGQVRIRASDRTDTVVTVHPTDPSDDRDVQAANDAQVEYANGQLLVKASPTSKVRSLLGRPASIDLTVDLPSESRVDAKAWTDIGGEGRIGDATFETAAGSIRLDQTGRLKLRTAAGDVSVGRSRGHVVATTSSGKVRIGEIDGTAVVKTSNGDISVGAVTSDIRLRTANGDITVDRALATVLAKTAYGNVRVGEVVRGTIVLQSGFGELALGVRQGTAAWLDVSSRSGSVRSDLEATEAPGPSDETVDVRARTGFGDIVIRRTEPAA